VTAVISGVRLAAGHEGVAEIVVSLTFTNGGQSQVALDHVAGARLMQNCGATQIDELIGQGWEHVRDALAGAYNGLD
jgi:hypothetical protein